MRVELGREVGRLDLGIGDSGLFRARTYECREFPRKREQDFERLEQRVLALEVVAARRGSERPFEFCRKTREPLVPDR